MLVYVNVESEYFSLKAGIGKLALIVGDFNTPLLVIDKTGRQKISKDINHLSNTINQFALIDICMTLIDLYGEMLAGE